MKASEVIAQLHRLLEAYGDLDTLYLSEDELVDVTNIDLQKDPETDEPGSFVIA